MKTLNLLTLALILFVSFSCKQNTGGTADESNAEAAVQVDTAAMLKPKEELGPPKYADALIEKAEVREDKDPDKVFVMLHGTFAKPCEQLGETTQKIEGNNIFITVLKVLPPGVNCPPVNRPMHHSVQIDTKDLKPGKYNVDVNGVKTSFVKK